MMPSNGPRCPNHDEPLEGCGFPLPRKGTGICPVSKYPFAFEVESDSKKAQELLDKELKSKEDYLIIIKGSSLC